MLTVSEVTKSYGGRTLFEDVSTTFDPGRRYGLTGANGAGKSTFMKILSGELEPDKGGVHTPPNSRMSILHQDHYKYGEIPTRDVVVMGNKRLWAQLPEGNVPDGICLDAQGGIWSASPTSNECVRVVEGGEITHRIDLERGAFACMIGAGNLYVLTSTSSIPDECRAKRDARVEVYAAPYPAAGWP